MSKFGPLDESEDDTSDFEEEDGRFSHGRFDENKEEPLEIKRIVSSSSNHQIKPFITFQ